MVFCERVRKLIDERKINVNRFRTDLGLGVSTFTTWEKRGTIPKEETTESN